eukprot:Blabericola_migrator_1__6048@NODE_3049_length_2087_cov_4_106931_g1904_i0_p3_GENE_NODE_3049_length_2087_cov_4_106931_g1904_i0NODE_3049_length_2087_cov_4_106931_g1904_i0_p3_ORF_typecomplete_len100_score3_56TEP1_N/PF05386_11/0_047TEP1_N/PF05386_11/3_1e03_NODE_3049_length_2087_cov_4_106931_g1904_i07131012
MHFHSDTVMHTRKHRAYIMHSPNDMSTASIPHHLHDVSSLTLIRSTPRHKNRCLVMLPSAPDKLMGDWNLTSLSDLFIAQDIGDRQPLSSDFSVCCTRG